MSQTDLNKYLHTAIAVPCYYRPFVCAGRPETCTIMIVGENPVTATGQDWWAFWDDINGFDLQRFEQDYEKSRHIAGKRPVSNTRLRLNRLRSHGFRCLETNAFANERLDGHGEGLRNADLLQVLVTDYLPLLKAVVTHGVVAAKCIAALDLPPSIQLYNLEHFRNLSYAKLDATAKLLA